MPYKDREVRNQKYRERYQNDPDFRERMKTKARNGKKKQYHALYSSDPAFRAKVLAQNRQFYQKRKAEDPAYRREYMRNAMRRYRATRRQTSNNANQP